jgi:uncharacterized membrane protein
MQFEVMFTNVFLRLLLQLKHAYAPLANLSHSGAASLEGEEEAGGGGGGGGGGRGRVVWRECARGGRG